MTSSSNPAEVKEAKRKAKDAEAQEIDDLLEVMSTIEGRRFIWRLLSSCRIYESPFNSSGTIQSQNMGRGDVGRQLIVWLSQADPKAYPTLMLEMAAQR